MSKTYRIAKVTWEFRPTLGFYSCAAMTAVGQLLVQKVGGNLFSWSFYPFNTEEGTFYGEETTPALARAMAEKHSTEILSKSLAPVRKKGQP